MYGGCFDISHNNGPIKWSQVPDNYRLVFIKATQGRHFIDPKLDENWDGADDTNRLVIPYHFITADPPEIQAANFVDNAELTHGSAAMLDWEGQPPPPLEILEEMIQSIRTTTGRAPIIYHGIYDTVSKVVNNCPWFLPKWGKVPDEKFKWVFWQDSARGVIPGVNGQVDHDWFVGTVQELEKFHQDGTLPEDLILPLSGAGT